MSTTKHSIAVDKATELTSRYEKNRNKILKEEFKGKDILPLSETFDRASFDQLLSQEGCVGVRIYFGMDEKQEVSLVLRGVDKDGQDIYPANNTTRALKKSTLIEEPVLALAFGTRCPPDCPPPPPPPNEP